MRKQPRISSAPISQLTAVQQAVYNIQVGTLNGNTVTVPVNSVGSYINLAYLLVSPSGTVTNVSGNNAVITGINTAGISLSLYYSTPGTGSANFPSSFTSILSPTSAAVSAISPTAGTITNIYQLGSFVSGAWNLDLTGISLSVNYTTTVTVTVYVGTSATVTLYVNGIQATNLGNNRSVANNSMNQYIFTIICTAPNQYSYYVLSFSL